ncbi:mono/diheme cytochrome c family protein [Pedobacter sp. W3I1]|uniref:c-type cytochrome domain-containing protein n=1 Tax=Pedobacter sp. W3I1 TaxID=3042291 RepID=UPI002780002E|nr:c-type cytochrome domain-containing protein [Pedobacter sp. W3I1]MDQ0637655.1 mono/diheme cytochrome c family protein [Pedobacter sp. W3I1]
MLEFFGRFHPVFVHLPIGILLLGCICILLSFAAKFINLKPAIPIMLLLGALSAVVSCITGYLLANGGDYDGKLVSNHQWMGISVAVLSFILWMIYLKVKSNAILGTIAVVLIVLISITGHLGGSLTHGSDYLTAPLKSGSTKGGAAIPPIPNVQEAFIYQNAIQPLFQNRCYSCHGSEKQKGKLRLDQEEYILKGGEDGHTIVKGKADDSELMKRILLPLNDEDHMAPKEKPQLTPNEITLLKWWIDNGADFKKKFKDLPQPENIKTILASLQKGESGAGQIKASDIPAKEVSAVDNKVLKKFTDAGISVFPVAQNTNYLSANFINAQSLDKDVLDLIKSIEKQLLWLKLENNKVNDQTLTAIKDCINLTRLNLNNTQITDAGLASLKDLDQLQSLSLVGTKITAKGINQLKKLKNLKFLYIYQTGVNKTDLASIKKLLPKVSLDTGNYTLPKLAQDTTVFKAP